MCAQRNSGQILFAEGIRVYVISGTDNCALSNRVKSMDKRYFGLRVPYFPRVSSYILYIRLFQMHPFRSTTAT